MSLSLESSVVTRNDTCQVGCYWIYDLKIDLKERDGKEFTNKDRISLRNKCAI